MLTLPNWIRRARCRAAALIIAAAMVTWLSVNQPVRAGGSPTDGVLCGIFVSTTGVDDVPNGLTPDNPVRTINFAIARAQGKSLSCIFVRAGTYPERVTLVPGIVITGGYNANWEYGSYSLPGHATIIAAPTTTPPYASVVASGLSGTKTSLINVIVQGPNAPGVANGQSSYGVYAANNAAPIILENLHIDGGNGANGLPGVNGDNAPSLVPTAGMNGAPGQTGQEVGACDDSTQLGGGPGGVNPCVSGSISTGGVGGAGGKADTECGFPPVPSATVGGPGSPGAQSGGGFGSAGSGGPLCGGGTGGAPGRITNGAPGAGAATTGSVTANLWAPASGGSGGIGNNGGGGGGGGGAGGCDTGTDAYGGSGGGGGAGGCRAPVAAAGGGGGGGSFGVFAVNSTLTLRNVEIVRGFGGNGGRGGDGGQGQLGGSGGPGGSTPDGGNGGSGGAGGHGGHGGGGGGGAGGVSYGVYCQGSSIATLGVTYSGGGAGAGGSGGISAPFAPGSIDDGNDGMAGVNGLLATITGCGSTTALVSTVCDPNACLGEPCVADIVPPGGDGVVNIDDLVKVITSWGNCP